jgi:hypothetical protein
LGAASCSAPPIPHQCLLPSTANDTLKVVHATPTATNSATYDVAVSFDLGDGQGRRTVTASYTADGSATVQEIVEALQVKLDSGFPANSIAVTEDDAKIIFTSEVPNLDFVVTATASTTAWTVTVATEIVPLRFLGVSVYSASVPQDANGTTAYQGGDALSILTNGEIAVELDAGITPSVGDPCVVPRVGVGLRGAWARSAMPRTGPTVSISPTPLGWMGSWRCPTGCGSPSCASWTVGSDAARGGW